MIKDRLRDIVMILYFYTGIPVFCAWILRHRHGQILRIISFHDIPKDQYIQFQKKIQWLQQHCHIISPQDIARPNTWSRKKINVLLTFDDGYASWMDTALPILQKYGIQALFFIASGFVEAGERGDTAVVAYCKERLLLRPRMPLTWKNIEEIRSRGHVIGGHTYSHISCIKDAGDVIIDIKKDMHVLHKHTGKLPLMFAYPFGDLLHISDSAIQAVKTSGYEYAFTTMISFNTPNTNPYLFSRDCIDADVQFAVFVARVYGAYDVLKHYYYLLMKWLLYRWFCDARYRV